jgi:hypothetical protein
LRQFARGYVRGYLAFWLRISHLQFCKFEAIRGGPNSALVELVASLESERRGNQPAGNQRYDDGLRAKG